MARKHRKPFAEAARAWLDPDSGEGDRDRYAVPLELTYARCARRFGWTPDEVDGIDQTLLQRIVSADYLTERGELHRSGLTLSGRIMESILPLIQAMAGAR